jgi:predicted TIM-barrel enzyme
MRPKKNEAERRGEIIRVRLTTKEAAALSLQADSAGLTISDFIRSKIVAGEDTQGRRVSRQRQLPGDVAEAVRVLSRIGVNLQTLKDRAVRDGQTVDTAALHEAVAVIVEILKRLKG